VGPPRGFVPLRQSNEFSYLCGLQTAQSYLLLDGREGSSALFLPPRGRGQLEEGAPPGLEDGDLVRAITGVEDVLPVSGLADRLVDARLIYTPYAPAEVRATCRHELQMADATIAHDPWDGRPARELQLVALLRSRYPAVTVEDLTPLLDEMRSVKSPREIAVMRRAGKLCADAVTAAMRVTRPGAME
jgi:Xaa-Pro aminopeptidase